MTGTIFGKIYFSESFHLNRLTKKVNVGGGADSFTAVSQQRACELVWLLRRSHVIHPLCASRLHAKLAGRVSSSVFTVHVGC